MGLARRSSRAHLSLRLRGRRVNQFPQEFSSHQANNAADGAVPARFIRRFIRSIVLTADGEAEEDSAGSGAMQATQDKHALELKEYTLVAQEPTEIHCDPNHEKEGRSL